MYKGKPGPAHSCHATAEYGIRVPVATSQESVNTYPAQAMQDRRRIRAYSILMYLQNRRHLNRMP